MFPTRLISGYGQFLEGRFSDESLRYRVLADKGQTPEIMVISCCDSRVAPEVVFDAGPGELFVVRNVANLVPPYEADTNSYHGTSAALDYAVLTLGVKHIVVLGHAFCGGISACCEQHLTPASNDFIGKWVSQITPVAKDLAQKYYTDNTQNFFRALELAVVKHSMNNLLSFPYIQEKVNQGELSIHGAYFGVASGRLLVLDSDTGAFVPANSRYETPEWASIVAD